jgi:hypothetical protein
VNAILVGKRRRNPRQSLQSRRTRYACHLSLEPFPRALRGGAKGEGYSWYIRDPWDHQIELKTDKPD